MITLSKMTFSIMTLGMMREQKYTTK